MKKVLVLLVLVLNITGVMAQDNTGGTNGGDEPVFNPNPVVIEKKMTIRSHDTDVVPFNRFMRIDRILIEARSGLSCGPSNLLVSVDGYADNKKNVWIPSNLTTRKFIVEMNGYSGRTLQLENEGSCKVIIKSIKVLPRRPNNGGHGGGGGGWIDPADIQGHVMNVVDIAQMLQDFVTPQEVVQYLTAWKKLAGKASSSINATGPSSTATRAALIALVKQLQADEAFIDRLISSTFTEDLGTQVMEAKIAIERSLL